MSFTLAISLLMSCKSNVKQIYLPEHITMSKTELKDKVKGGWAVKGIACTYDGPTEF